MLSPERQSARMSKNINGGLDQYGAGPFEQQQFGTAGVEGVKSTTVFTICTTSNCDNSYLWRNLQLRHLETLKLDSEISVSKYDYIIVWLNASWSGSALSVPSHFLIVAKMSLPKRSASYWSNPPFLIFDIRALWRSILSARVPECQKLKLVG